MRVQDDKDQNPVSKLILVRVLVTPYHHVGLATEETEQSSIPRDGINMNLLVGHIFLLVLGVVKSAPPQIDFQCTLRKCLTEFTFCAANRHVLPLPNQRN